MQLELSRAHHEVYEEVGRDLHSVYLWTAGNIDYMPRPSQERAPEGYTREQWFAFEGLTTGKGDCFVYAAAFAELARGLGYDAEYMEGCLVHGLWADHGFVCIHQDSSGRVQNLAGSLHAANEPHAREAQVVREDLLQNTQMRLQAADYTDGNAMAFSFTFCGLYDTLSACLQFILTTRLRHSRWELR